MGMVFSASGSLVTGLLWGGIAALRSPSLSTLAPEIGSVAALFASD
jgi:hypothetical protein